MLRCETRMPRGRLVNARMPAILLFFAMGTFAVTILLTAERIERRVVVYHVHAPRLPPPPDPERVRRPAEVLATLVRPMVDQWLADPELLARSARIVPTLDG